MAGSKLYETIPQLINKIKSKADLLEQGKLSVEEITELLKHSTDLHERIAILRYKLVEDKNVSQENIIETKVDDSTKEEYETPSLFTFNVKPKNEEFIHPNQTNLLDQIESEKKNVSVNEKLAETKKEQKTVAEKLQKSPIQDLRKVIGLNQKFLFMNDLFEGEKSNYDEALDKLNTFDSFDEANDYISEIKAKYNWENETESVISFVELVERRYA